MSEARRRGKCPVCDRDMLILRDGTLRKHGSAYRSCPGSGNLPTAAPWPEPKAVRVIPHVDAVEVETEPLRLDDGRLWIAPNDIAHLTMVNEISGETEVIRAMCIKPFGAPVGWVLSDGGRIPLRPRTVIQIDIVFPQEHRATEHVTHPEPNPESSTEHTTGQDTND